MQDTHEAFEQIYLTQLQAVLQESEAQSVSLEQVKQRLADSRVLCAGSFPFYFCGEARPFHELTKHELCALVCVLTRKQCAMPLHILQRIGEILQWSTLEEDYKQGNMDIDLFATHAVRSLFHAMQAPLWWRDAHWYHNQYETGDYAWLGDVFDTALLGNNPLQLQLISVNREPWSFIEESFDAPFCKNVFSYACKGGVAKLRLHKTHTRMRGSIALRKYKDVVLQILKRMESYPFMLEGMGAYLPARLASGIEQRLEKYERRRFTIDNATEVREFIAELRGMSETVIPQLLSSLFYNTA